MEAAKHVDHVVASEHGGATEEGNLALACARCNWHKGPNIAGIDPPSGQMVRLFHPRRDVWHEHFEWRAVEVYGKTPVGRLIQALAEIMEPRLGKNRQIRS